MLRIFSATWRTPSMLDKISTRSVSMELVRRSLMQYLAGLHKLHLDLLSMAQELISSMVPNHAFSGSVESLDQESQL